MRRLAALGKVVTQMRPAGMTLILAGRVGLAGAALGLIAGLLELTIGPSIRSWVGDKSDTTGLGITTIVLSLIALAAAVHALRHPAASVAGRLLIGAALLVPAGICFTTVGSLWYVPGPLLVAAGALAAVSAR